MRYAVAMGSLLIAASGNYGAGGGWQRQSHCYPARYSRVLAVGSAGYAPHAGAVSVGDHQFSNRNAFVDLCANGKDVLSTVPGGRYGVYTGTSMACSLLMAF